jgi:hypothetical protein
MPKKVSSHTHTKIHTYYFTVNEIIENIRTPAETMIMDEDEEEK